jgi:S-adenosylmethionine:tRNA-ribosyltransferase-isomerase (queuine synthetase)
MAMLAHGKTLLPPYSPGKRKSAARDAQDYRVAFAAVVGSVAALNAGLHFRSDPLARLEAAGET